MSELTQLLRLFDWWRGTITENMRTVLASPQIAKQLPTVNGADAMAAQEFLVDVQRSMPEPFSSQARELWERIDAEFEIGLRNAG